MLQIKNLTITHKKDLRVLLEDFHFVLNHGDKAVLIGEEGNGKSTLLKWIYSPEAVSSYAEAEGECIRTGETLGYLPQELPSEEGKKSVYEFFAGEELFWEQSPQDLSRLARNLNVPIDFFYGEQKMAELSGGEKVKAQMARILMAKPTVLLLDEPSNDIDARTLEWLEEFIAKAEQAFLYISHDETLIERTANVVIHLEQIRRKTLCRYTAARMSYKEYIQHRNDEIKKRCKEAENEKRQEEIRQEKLCRIMEKVDRSQENITRQSPAEGRRLKKKMKAMKSMEKRFEREAENMTQTPETEAAIFFKFGQEIRMPAGKIILDFALERLPVRGEEQNRILAENIRLTVRGPEKVCIVGKNGAGKTTLLCRIWEELRERKDIRAAYMPQNYEELLDMDKTPVEYLCQSGEKEEMTRIRTFLGSMKYTADEMNHAIGELSGGQKAKVLLLKMSLSGAEALILDEPTRNFSPLSNPVIREVLREYKGAIISISHDRKYIDEVCGSVYELTQEGLKVIKNSMRPFSAQRN